MSGVANRTKTDSQRQGNKEGLFSESWENPLKEVKYQERPTWGKLCEQWREEPEGPESVEAEGKDQAQCGVSGKPGDEGGWGYRVMGERGWRDGRDGPPIRSWEGLEFYSVCD